MVDDSFLQELLKRTLSHGGEYADIFIEHRETTSIQLEDNRIEKVISGSFSGIGIRLIYKGKTAYAFSNDFSNNILLDLAATVSKAATGSPKSRQGSPENRRFSGVEPFCGGADKAPDVIIDMKQQRPERNISIRIPPGSVPLDKKIAMVTGANNAARSLDPRVKQVNIIYRDS